MHTVGISVTILVLLCLSTLLEATYLERPLWVAEKGRPLELSRAEQVLAGNEQSWRIPEPYQPWENRVEASQWVQEQPKVREERPSYENQEMYYGQGTVLEAQPSWTNEQEKQIELPKPAEPSVVDEWKPVQVWPESAYPSLNAQQGWDVEPKPELTQPTRLQPQPQVGQEQYQSYQPQPEPPKPEQPKVQEMQQYYGKPQAEYEPMYQGQEAYNPYPARPELYRPNPSFMEPDYQASYYGQQPSQYMPDPEYQMPFNRKPDTNRVRKPQQEQDALGPNMGYPYQPQGWYPYQSQAVGRAPQVNRQPAQPPKVAQTPNRPIEPQPKLPVRVPSNPWETQYKPVQPVQPAPVRPKQPAQQRPQAVIPEPTYIRRPETYYEEEDVDDSEVVVKYAKPVTRLDARCPRVDDTTKPVHFPSATSCFKFQKCFNGIAYEMSCPSGLEFDSKNNRCDYPARAKCII
uniref:Chitin-binding type-2 domain-containing protein n=1 Tax=Anopheles christyi TaxID=43041 RepID=A0A182K5Z9_9DIPT